MKVIFLFVVLTTAFVGCTLSAHSSAHSDFEEPINLRSNPTQQTVKQSAPAVTFASFNVSFAHDGDPTENFEQWIKFMNIPLNKQNTLIGKWKAGDLGEFDKQLVERIIQIRNIAAIIQQVRPDVLLLNEFNNDGVGKNYQAIKGFQDNYLAVGQSLNSVNGGDLGQPIYYPYTQSYATNTGLNSGLDLSNNGYDKNDPTDAYGFGFYHGHYGFALFSKYEIDTANTRTFQTFKRKDLPNAINPIVNECNGELQLPENLKCGDKWFSDTQWNALRLSSKNHVDAPILIPTQNGIQIVHALLSHPTPPAFDRFADNNKYRNNDENLLWWHYLNGSETLYDDQGKTGGFSGQSFVIMGDLNADTTWGSTTDPRFNGIQTLMRHPLVNQNVVEVDGKFSPVSTGAQQEPNSRHHPYPAIRTATFGTRADYAVPSADLSVVDTGVFWKANNEKGRLLFNDPRMGERGEDKEVSSDHRLVWVTFLIEDKNLQHND